MNGTFRALALTSVGEVDSCRLDSLARLDEGMELDRYFDMALARAFAGSAIKIDFFDFGEYSPIEARRTFFFFSLRRSRSSAAALSARLFFLDFLRLTLLSSLL